MGLPLLPLLGLIAAGAAYAGQEKRPEPDMASRAAHVEHDDVREGDCAIAASLVIGRLLDLEVPSGGTVEQITALRASLDVPAYAGVDGDEVALLLMRMGAAIKEKPTVRLHRLMSRLTAGDLALVVGRYGPNDELHAIVVTAHPDFDGRWLIVHDSNYDEPYVAKYREVQAFRTRGDGSNQMYLVRSRR